VRRLKKSIDLTIPSVGDEDSDVKLSFKSDVADTDNTLVMKTTIRQKKKDEEMTETETEIKVKIEDLLYAMDAIRAYYPWII
jgi:hypothetical protein